MSGIPLLYLLMTELNLSLNLSNSCCAIGCLQIKNEQNNRSNNLTKLCEIYTCMCVY